jgi:GNAT superfamily N-acetyltransferase
MNDAELADLEHENMIVTMSAFCANVAGSRVWRADGVMVAATGLPFVLFNQVVVDGEATEPAAIAAGVAAMREGTGPFVVNLRSGRDDRFIPLMHQLGLVPISEQPWMPGMAWHPVVGADAPHPPGFEVRRVRDDGGLDAHVATGAEGFELPEEILRAVVTPALLDHAEMAIYVGYANGVPVCTGLGVRSGRTIGVYNVATIPAARGRGHGAAITRRVVADGVAAGCDVAILQASDMGFPIYERIGFRTVVEYVGFVDPSPRD